MSAAVALPVINSVDLTELVVEIPGGPYSRYVPDLDTGSPRLAEIVYPPERYPVDLCALVDSLADDGQAPLGALLLGTLSHPAGCRVAARLLGLLRVQSDTDERQYPILVAAADPHFGELQSAESLSLARRESVEWFVRLSGAGPTTMTWHGVEPAQELIHTARQCFRLARAGQRAFEPSEPAWKPARIGDQAGGRAEAERHTAAEYSFYRLPYRFQQYVEASLTRDERILFSVHRPAMRSALQRSRLSRQRLEEAVLIVSDRQVALVAELMPPDSAGIRYGMVDRVGVPERLVEAQVVELPNAVAGLALTWEAAGGQERVTWEFPAARRPQLETAVELLRGWRPRARDLRLRRASPPAAPDPFPRLTDPAANDPAEVVPLAARLEAALASRLCPKEVLLARCLIPAWVEHKDAARLLAVTTRRLLTLPDPGSRSAPRPEIDLPLPAISSLEFSSTLVNAYLNVSVPINGRVTTTQIYFTKTLAAMNDCYHMLRRMVGLVHLAQPSESKV